MSNDAAEQPYVAVLFYDIVGSTSLATALDAEELAGPRHTPVSGQHASKCDHADGRLHRDDPRRRDHGNGTGYPIAQENDAERCGASRARGIQRGIADLSGKNAQLGRLTLAARVGIEIGPVVVDASGQIFGDAPNIAARLQALAEPGAVLVTAGASTDSSRRLLCFVLRIAAPCPLKGVPRVRPRCCASSVPAAAVGGSDLKGLTPLVNRDEEMKAMFARWERGARRRRSVPPFHRRAQALESPVWSTNFAAALRDTPHTWVEWSASQLLQNTPLHPILDWGRLRFCDEAVQAEKRLRELETALAHGPSRSRGVRAVARAAGRYSFARRPGVRAVSRGCRSKRDLRDLVDWLMGGRRAHPADRSGDRGPALGRSLHPRRPERSRRARARASTLRAIATARPSFEHVLASRPSEPAETITIAPP